MNDSHLPFDMDDPVQLSLDLSDCQLSYDNLRETLSGVIKYRDMLKEAVLILTEGLEYSDLKHELYLVTGGGTRITIASKDDADYIDNIMQELAKDVKNGSK